MKLAPLWLGLALALGCSSGGSPDLEQPPLDGPVTGTVGGSAFTALGALAVRYPVDACISTLGTGPVLLLSVWLSASFDSTYMLNHACSSKASSRDVGVAIWQHVASGQIPPGLYPRSETQIGGQVVFEYRLDGTCTPSTSNLSSSSGTVGITANDATHVRGWLRAFFPGGGQLEGWFDAQLLQPWMSVCQYFGLPGGTDGPGCTAACVP